MDSEVSTLHNLSRSTSPVARSEKQADKTHKTPSTEIKQALSIYLSIVAKGSLAVILVIFAILPIYWGALWKTNVHTHNIEGWVIDFDGGAIGQAVVAAVHAFEPAPTKLTWVVKDASQFPGGPEELAQKVHEQHVWIGVSVNPNASNSLALALASPAQSTSYNASLAITGYGEEARNENGFRSVIRPQFDALMQSTLTQFASQFAKQNISTLPQEQIEAILTSAPQLVTRPVYYTLSNLRPFDVPVATAVTFVGLIYLVILSFMVTNIAAAARQAAGLDSNLSIRQLITLRLTTSFVVYFVLSLFYSLLSLAFQTPFSRHFGKSGFLILWMLQWMGMLALGLALETMFTLLTQRFIAFFLVLWIITNVSVSFFPLELLPRVYRYGHAMPFLNISQGIRSIVFGVKNDLGINFAVLIGWAVLSCITLTLVIALTRRNQVQRSSEPLKKVDTEATVSV